jgi:hypothetical protein
LQLFGPQIILEVFYNCPDEPLISSVIVTDLLWPVCIYEKMVKILYVSASAFPQINSEFIKLDGFEGAGELLIRGMWVLQ